MTDFKYFLRFSNLATPNILISIPLPKKKKNILISILYQKKNILISI